MHYLVVEFEHIVLNADTVKLEEHLEVGEEAQHFHSLGQSRGGCLILDT
jgi:hypothetical protein